ncbi:hypothetical protein PV04_02857 [Phialophora macrospora]|uniref:Uncharacterized protein n=1 Tax=Phialophora macrospora TaxID=1851006 RepID=A0A0D2CZG4_9EURO|nr:hypothetical protein PV04_02857 [Phialophora macrospora]
MSWKLAELRWRHDIGLNERRGKRDEESGQNGGMGSLRGVGLIRMKHVRSHSAPWCRVVEESILSEPSVCNAIRPDPWSLALSPGLSETSTIPLLKKTQSRTDTIADHRCATPLGDQHEKKSELSLSHLQTPLQPNSFLGKHNLCSHFDGVQRTVLPQEDCLASPKVTTPSSASSGKSGDNLVKEHLKTPQRPLSAGFQSTSDGPSPFEFQFARTPSFGLHFCQSSRLNSQEDNAHTLNPGHPGLWTRAQSLSPSVRRTSLESRHHSDSALLQKVSMDVSTCYSSPDRRATRPLFPDLPSAYARIQGRRAVSLQPASSSRSRTRFPLSPSSSSSDEELLGPSSLGSDGIRLKNLRCRKVRSAQIVLHEADHHPESSAIFETSDENTEPKRKKGRASTTLEEIVSQDADASRSESALLNDRVDFGRPEDQRPVVQYRQARAAEADPFHAGSSRPSDIDSAIKHYQLYEQRGEPIAVPAHRNDGLKEEDECWEEGPESSRRGFFTPSKLRFRLRKRQTVDTRTSILSGRTPVSPWDPLSNSTQSKPSRPRPHLHHNDHRTHAHSPLSPDRRGHRGYSAENKQTNTTTPRSGAASKQTKDTDGHRCRPDSKRTPLASPPNHSTLTSRPLNRITTSYANSRSLPRPSSGLLISHDLVSSPLLPKILDNSCAPRLVSPSTMNSTETAPREVAGDPTFELSYLGADAINGGGERYRSSGATSPHRKGATCNAGDPIERPIEAVQSATTFETLIPRLNADSYTSHNVIHPSMTQDEVLMARYLYEGGYTLNDRDLSRFLRDSRRLRHGLETAQGFIDNHSGLAHRAFGTIGSSLANISSNSSTLNRVHVTHASNSGSHYSDDDDYEEQARIGSQPARRVLLGNGSSTSEYSSLENVRAVLVCNEVPISADERVVQRTAGTLLLAFGVVAYVPGGWVLIHSLGEGGPLATTAMAEVTRVLVGTEEGVVCCVHPTDAAMARAIERGVLVLVVVAAFSWLAVAAWAATW